MCRKTYDRENAEIKTAESDIPVFKVVVADSNENGEDAGVKVRPEEVILLDAYYPRNGELTLMDCVIPKGARYCVNEFGEYVSDTIRVEGFRPLNETACKKEES